MKRALFNIKTLLIISISALSFYSCSASTGSRYVKENKVISDNTSDQKNETIKTSPFIEDFDITPYKTEIIVHEKNIKIKMFGLIMVRPKLKHRRKPWLVQVMGLEY
jgi:uncharacterized protein YxeA